MKKRIRIQSKGLGSDLDEDPKHWFYPYIFQMLKLETVNSVVHKHKDGRKETITRKRGRVPLMIRSAEKGNSTLQKCGKMEQYPLPPMRKREHNPLWAVVWKTGTVPIWAIMWRMGTVPCLRKCGIVPHMRTRPEVYSFNFISVQFHSVPFS